MEERLRFLVLNGPSINLLGEREPEIYGTLTLANLEDLCRAWGEERNIEIRCAQSNHEGELVDILQEARHEVDGVVLNAAAYTHTSAVLRDCIAAIQPPVIEVHISNTAKREAFRSRSYLTAVAAGLVMGFGIHGYILALEGLLEMTGGSRIHRKKNS
ncbi:MAG: type II 3-dehydroquinate dehydratase [Thermovirgaceae bacterium]|nr:type II 3-dehydroquinate dehydratase [Thermovirgaceae bacterium]